MAVLRKILIWSSVTLVVLLLAVLLLLGGLSAWLNTDAARQQVFQAGIGMLREKLQTNVTADSISIALMKGQVRIYGMQVNDRQDSMLMRFDELHAGIAPHDLLDRRVRITDVELKGADARLWRDSLTSNFQFVLDAFKKKQGKEKAKRKTQKWELEVDVKDVNLHALHVKWDVRHKPRKNKNRPNRGAFDANHVDVLMDMKASVAQPANGTYDVDIRKMKVYDVSCGLKVEHLNAHAILNKEKIDVEGVQVKLQHSQVDMGRFTIDLKKKSIPEPFTLTAFVLLQDIAEPFAPPLSHFTTPLELTAKVGGPLQCLSVDDILVHTPDRRLTLTAHGTLGGLFGRKEGLNLKFRNIDLKAKHNMKEQIVMHFAKKVRLKMIRQMKAIGDIRFLGTLDVLYKREIIAGKLFTPHGNLTTRFTVDGNTKYMTGYVKTPSFDMGKVMNIDKLGPVKCHIDFHLNTSKKTPRPATALPNGRLPMGEVTARVYDARYSTVTAPEVNLKVKSDGSTASGYLWLAGALKNMSARVNYVQTDKEQKVWFHFTHNAQQWLLNEGVGLLSEKFHAGVEADSINVHLFDGEARLYGIRVEDRQHQPLFSLDTLHVTLDAQELLHHKVHVTHVGLYGLQAQLSKDSVDANFRFLMQSFKKKKKAGGNAATTKKKKKMLELVVDLKELVIENMRVKWDVTDKERKNHGNPKRGAFDANHVDVVLNLQAGMTQTADGGYAIDLRKMDLTDVASGLRIDDLHTRAVLNKGLLSIDGLHIRMPQSWVSMEPFALNLKTMQIVKPFMVHAHVVLQDIAQPFAPLLGNFTTPLELSALIGGSIRDLHVDDIAVQTENGRMTLAGRGILGGLTSKKDSLNLGFRDLQLTTDNETLMQLVMHFAKTVRLKMVRQMKKVGDVHFSGDLDVLYKRENVSGHLTTEYGDVETRFSLDGNTHFMTGYIDAPALDLGKFLNVKRLGAINGHIDFNFNISSKTPRPATALPNGRLPQGSLFATILDARYGVLHAKRIEATANSDGSTATGSIRIPRIVSDLYVNFNYVQTDDEQRVRVRPKHKFHWFFWRKKRSLTTTQPPRVEE